MLQQLCRYLLHRASSSTYICTRHDCRLFSTDSKNNFIRKGRTDVPTKPTGSLYQETDQYHMPPMGNSNVSQKTTITQLSDAMVERNDIGVKAYNERGFRMYDDKFLYGPIAVFPKVALSWRVLTPDDITVDSVEFFALLEPKLDVVVIGVGDRKHVDAVRRRITTFFEQHRIGLEVLPTEPAIGTFNFLNSEGRYVAAGLYPPDEFEVSAKQLNTLARELENPDVAMWDPIVSTYLTKRFDVIKKLWSLKDNNNGIDEVTQKKIEFDDSLMTKRIDGKISRYDENVKEEEQKKIDK